MPEMEKPAGEDEKPQSRRALKACIPCKLGKRKCNHERPCGPCCARGLQSECVDEIKEIDPACTLCKKRKLKCDRRRPCGRCYRQGRSEDCIEDGKNSIAALPVKRQPDSALSEIVSSQVISAKRQRVVPNADALYDEDVITTSVENTEGDTSDTYSDSPSPSELSFAGTGHRVGPCILAPENPMPFPDGTFNGWSSMLPNSSLDGSWPKSLVRMFKTYRTSDIIYNKMLNNMSPKLLSSVLRIFRAVDTVLGLQKKDAEPTPPEEWNTANSWQHSLRCGMQMVRVDRAMGVMSGVEVNPFWTDLAGLHREEFINRAFNGEMNLPTSELRQACKLMFGIRDVIKAKLQSITTGAQPKLELKPVYGRFSRNWGRGELSEGVLIRMRTTSTYDSEGKWLYLHHSLVVVSPEEYEAVRAQQPELCEGYMIPVVGSKSARELMDPQLLRDESFEHLNATAEGRERLDALADKMSEDFGFLFDFLGRAGLSGAVPAGS